MPAPTVILRLLKGDAQEMAELQHVLEAAPTYAERITGAPPGSADAQSVYSVLPPDKGYEDKFVLGVYLEDVMIGCVDLIRGYPDGHTAHLGLLLLAESYQRRGIGKAAYLAVEDYVRRWGPEWTRVRIGVVRTNEEVLSFWTKLGFAPTGEVKPYRYANVASETLVLCKSLAGA
jgi:GNAT superfamily N-acetyltransferase